MIVDTNNRQQQEQICNDYMPPRTQTHTKEIYYFVQENFISYCKILCESKQTCTCR